MLKRALKAANLTRLVAPAPTQWGSLIGCFRSLRAADTVLNAIVSHRDFAGGSGATTKQKEQRKAIKDIITARDFVDYLTKSIKLLEPNDMLITKFQSDSVTISDVYQAFVKVLPQMFTITGTS